MDARPSYDATHFASPSRVTLMRHHIHPRLCALFLALLAAVALPSQAQTINTSGANDAARVIVKFKADSSLTLQTRALSAGAREANRAQALGARLGMTI